MTREQSESATYRETFCTLCGADESGAVSVEKEVREPADQSNAMRLAKHYQTTLRCANCDIEEIVNTGLVPESETEAFGYRKRTDEETKLLINGQRVHFRDIDENIVESALIDNDGVGGTSRAHHLHVHAWNAPTLTKNSAHHVQIAGYLDQRMMLVGIRYHDSKNRTLKFYRGLDKGILNKMNELEDSA